MIVLNPDQTSHEIVIIPRFYFQGEVVMELYNEDKSTTLTFELTPTTIYGYVYLMFDQEFENNTNYQIKITLGNSIVYRGKLFVTNQTDDLQDYKITKDVFII